MVSNGKISKVKMKLSSGSNPVRVNFIKTTSLHNPVVLIYLTGLFCPHDPCYSFLVFCRNSWRWEVGLCVRAMVHTPHIWGCSLAVLPVIIYLSTTYILSTIHQVWRLPGVTPRRVLLSLLISLAINTSPASCLIITRFMFSSPQSTLSTHHLFNFK